MHQPVQDVFGRLFRLSLPFRFGGALMLVTVAILYACFDPTPWKVVLPAIIGLAMAGSAVWDLRRFPSGQLEPRQVAWHMGTVVVGYCTLAVLTGGIRSPFLVAAPMLTLATVLGTGQPRLFVPHVLVLMTLGWLLALGDLLGPLAGLVPALFRDGSPAPSPAGLTIAWASFLTMALVLPTVLGLRIRRALDRAVAEATRAREEHAATLQAHNTELMELSRTVAHELRNPLASIQGLAGLLARRQAPGSREEERAGVLIDETKRLGALLDELINFGRPVQGLAVRPVEPGELVASTARLFDARLAALGVSLRTELGTVRPLRCDPRKLQQVLVNLVDNAIQASPRRGRVVLRVEEAEDGGHAITVLDEGPGLPPEVRATLFRPGTTTRPGGSGLGLAIARQIARQHGGDVTLDDRPEGGCIARVHLPRRTEGAEQ
jgi:two-component system, NtrC family, sensor histidine kinase HydH